MKKVYALILLFIPQLTFALDLSGTWTGSFNSADDRNGKVTLVLKHTDKGYAATLDLQDPKCKGVFPKEYEGMAMMETITLVTKNEGNVMFAGAYENKQLTMTLMMPNVPATCSPITLATYEFKLKRK